MAGALVAGGLLASTPAQATEIGQNGHPLGLGITLGAPTGLSGRYYLGGRANAIQFTLASWDYGYRVGGWYLGATYLWHPSVLASEVGFELPWHVGVGGFLADAYYGYRNDVRYYGGDTAAGVNVPIGLDLDLNDVRLQFSGDVFARILVIPDIDLDIGASLAIRYYF